MRCVCVHAQLATMNTIACMGFLNMGTMMALSPAPVAATAASLEGPATLCMGLAAVFAFLVFRGFKRVQRLDKFEKEMRG
jgi:hypothetical protein